MNILIFSGDTKALEPESAVSARLRLYAEEGDAVSVVVLGVGQRQEVAHHGNVSVILPGGKTKRAAFFNAITEGKRLLAGGNLDIIMTQDPFFIGLVALRARGKKRIPLQVQIHTDFLNWAYFLESPRRAFEVMCAFFVLKQASCIRAVSKRIARSLQPFTKASVSVLPLLVSLSTQEAATRPHNLPEGKVALVASRLAPEKNIRLAIDAAMRVPDLTLVIAGDGVERNKLEQYARNLVSAGRVQFIGWQESLVPYFAHADVFIQTSRYEGFGMSLVEAARSHCPIVGTRAGVLGEEFVHGKHALIGKDAKELAAHIEDTLTNTGETQKRIENAYEIARTFMKDPKTYATAQRQLLSNCIAV